MSFSLSISPGLWSRSLAAAVFAAAFASAQTAPADDPYGIGDSPSASPTPAAPDTVRAPATPAPPAPAAAAVDSPRTAAADTLRTGSALPDTATPRAIRPRITRETTVNPMDMKRGSYRNPKKALFMSLVVPGLGQAYIGQSTFNYVRAALYFTADVTMGYMWYNYSVVKYDKKVKQYRTFADQHWSQIKYENNITVMIGTVTEKSLFDAFNPGRENYCAAVQERSTGTGDNQYKGCVSPYGPDNTTQNHYSSFRTSFEGDTTAALASARRAGYPGDVQFYEMIGRDQDFIRGWTDVIDDPGVPGFELADTTWMGTSANRESYNAMRQTAKDYSRMQTWFLGGIVLNHIASAVDAAITARRHNKILYEDGGASWYDKVNLDGGMAMDLGRPRTYMTAHLSF